MSFVVIVRGPLGVGKTTVSRALAARLRAGYISIDQILDRNGLWESGRLSEFLAANEQAARSAGRFLDRGRAAVVDGNFYWRTQVHNLVRRLRAPHFIFTLRAPLRICIDRDARRARPHGARATRIVFARVTAVRGGVGIDATRSVASVVGEIETKIAARLARA